MNTDKQTISDYTQSSLLRILLSDRTNLFWIFIASSFANLLLLTPMIYMLQIFDRIFISKSILTLVTISGIIILFYVINALSTYIRSQIVISMGLKIEKKVNERLFYVGFEERLRRNVDNPASYLDDLTLVRQWLTGAAVFAVFDLPWVPFYVLVMFIMHPILGFASLLMITIFIIIGIIFSKIIGNQDELLRQEEYETNDFLYGKLRNSEVLSVYALASNFKKTWVENKQKFYVTFSNSQKKTDAVQNFIKQYRFFSNSLALTIGALLVIYGELTLGSMIAASLLMARTTQPVDASVAALSRAGIVKEAFWRIEEMLNRSLAKKYGVNDRTEDKWDGQQKILNDGVRLEKVSVAFEEGAKKVLENINLTFRRGEVVAIVGNSGVGKTTLIKLVSGLVDFEGNVKFDERSLTSFSVSDSYKMIGYLPQDVLLVPGTIADNIAGLRKPDSEQVVKVAKLVGIHDFILKFPAGYDTDITASLQTLSGGERQRIGLARAIYNKPACLFLDEPNSALDYSGELALKNVITNCRNNGMLVLVVTHRRSVLSYTDRVLDLSNTKGLQLQDREAFLQSFQSKAEFDRRFTF